MEEFQRFGGAERMIYDTNAEGAYPVYLSDKCHELYMKLMTEH